MKKLFKIVVAIGGAIAGILAIFAASKSSQSKKEFNKRVKANNEKLDFITKKADKVKKDKAVTKSKIKSTSAKIKATKSKVKSTRSAKKTVDSFEKKYRKKQYEKYIINGIENRIEQIIANLLDNSISFCKEGENIFVNISNTVDKKILLKIIDDGQGFKEKDTSKIFKRFYSNRPDKFGEHSGLGLNIVKNLVDLHDGEIVASNRLDRDGAIVEIRFPSVQS